MTNNYKKLSIEESYKLITEFFAQIDNELKNKNRFMNPKLDAIVEALTSNSENIKEYDSGILKRARIYTESDAFERFLHPVEGQAFNGYDAPKSFVNERGCSEGRCNPKFIPYLYAANSVDCCISEINPSIDSIISVADIQITDKLRVLNLAESYYVSSGFGTIIEGVPNCDVFLYLQNLFSRPHESESDYYLTQYISEKIKNAGFDGLSFASSKYAYKDSAGITKHGYNFVIFNYQKCTSIGSKLYRVTTISYGLQEQMKQ